MGQEKNIESIRALEKQIRDGNGDIIKLKRARNSLLNISLRTPPEILGYIFAWTLARDEEYSVHSDAHFSGLDKGSYNFILVCHHWFKVASSTPQLWSFWGNSLRDWKRLYRYAGAVPTDLVMDMFATDLDEPSFDPVLCVLINRAAQDKIRQIHLRDDDTLRVGVILSLLTPSKEETSEKCIESIALSVGAIPEFSDFFARSHLPKLQHLNLFGTLPTSVWDNLTPKITRLTVLSLWFTDESLPPTAPQLLSILSSNPNLRELDLADQALPKGADRSGIQVSLPQLKTINLTGGFRRVFGLLNQLQLPAELDCMDLNTTKSRPTTDEILRTVGPHLQDRFRRDTRFQNKLEVSISFERRIQIVVCRTDNHLAMGSEPKPGQPYLRFLTSRGSLLPSDPVMKNLALDLMAFAPREHVAYLRTHKCFELPEEAFVARPNIETLSLQDITLSEGFLQPNPDGPYANTKLLPSLKLLRLTKVATKEAGWKPLVSYLAHQTSGCQVVSLELSLASPALPWEFIKEAKDLVEEFRYRGGHVHGDLSSRESYVSGWGAGLVDGL